MRIVYQNKKKKKKEKFAYEKATCGTGIRFQE